MEAIELPVEARERVGKGPAARARREGLIPAVLYGPATPPKALSVNEAELLKVLRSHGNRLSLLSLTLGSTKEPAILKGVQRDPVNEHILHLDFLRVALDKPLNVEIPVVVEGVAPGVKLGGVMQQSLRHVRVRCLPTEIPEGAVADVSKMEIGHVLAARDLKLPAGATLLTDPIHPVFSIVVTHYEEETAAAATTAAGEAAAATAAAEPAQPEVIGEKEREERRLAKDQEKTGKAAEKAELKEIKAKEEKKK